MAWWKALLGAGCAAPLAGCNVYQLAGHNLYNEPVSRADEHHLSSRLREEARLAWREVCRQYPGRSFTPEFADGFLDGHADHLERGGPPRPPAVPPLKYRRSKYFTPEGSLRVRDYLCGAKYGAEVAAATGFRQYLTVPVMLAEPHAPPPQNVIVLPPPPDPDAAPAGEKPAAPVPTGPPPPPKPLAPDKPAADLPLPPVAPPITPKLEPARPAPVPFAPPQPADPLPGPGDVPLGTPPKDPAPRPSPLKPGETGTGLPAVDLPLPDFLAPPPAALRRTAAAVEPAPPPAPEPPRPPAGLPPKPRAAADAPPKGRPAAVAPPTPR